MISPYAYAVLGALVMAITNIFTKYLNTRAYNVKYIMILQLVLNTSVAFLLTRTFTLPSTTPLLVVLLVNIVLGFVATYFQYQAYNTKHTGIVATILATAPVFSIITVVVLGVTILPTMLQWLGILIILLGTIILKTDFKKIQKIDRKPFLYALIGALCFGLGTGLAVLLLTDLNSAEFYQLRIAGMLLVYLAMAGKIDWHKNTAITKTEGWKASYIWLAGLGFLLANQLILYSLQLGANKTISLALSETVPLFVTLLAWIIYKETPTRTQLMAMALICLGAALL